MVLQGIGLLLDDAHGHLSKVSFGLVLVGLLFDLVPIHATEKDMALDSAYSFVSSEPFLRVLLE